MSSSKEKKHVDVLICGAGPVGLFLSNELAAFKVNFRIIEKLDKHPNFSKAIFVSPRTLEIFDNRGLIGPFLENGVKVKQFITYQTIHELFKFDLSSINSLFPYALMSRQNKTVDYLIDALHQKKLMGTKNVPNVEYGSELIKYEEKDDHIVAIVKNINSGKEEEIICRYLVGCDGVHSSVRKGRNDWIFEGQTLKFSWAVADVSIDHELVRDDQVTLFAAAEVPEEHITLDKLQKLVDKKTAPIKFEIKNPVWLANFKVSERIANRYRIGRVFLAGDAAHCHSPVGGQGMNLGIQDAHNLAFKLALVIRNQTINPDKVLNSYEQERRPVGKNVVSGTSFATKMLSGNDFISAFLRMSVVPFMSHFFPQIVSNYQSNLFQIDLKYFPETSDILHKYKPLSRPKNKLIKAGHYAKDGLLKKVIPHKSHDCITLFDVFRSTALKHTLILFTLTKDVTADRNPLINTLLEIYSDYKNIITPIIVSFQGAVQTADVPFMPFFEEGREQHIFMETKFELHEKYGITKEIGQQAFVLIRPDLYIASAVLENDVDKLKAFLEG
ncbi:9496_t:CDS:2 [Cetraspora pellucida]|uniref:9496_t:CDS:1 n=1 Tax=Cetraspora pellucida TaxID=1433469 RepID=A0A9N8W2H3_9GLOM|nr:9496_t:CDS:2 [Cetraspora pellucida]